MVGEGADQEDRASNNSSTDSAIRRCCCPPRRAGRAQRPDPRSTRREAHAGRRGVESGWTESMWYLPSVPRPHDPAGTAREGVLVTLRGVMQHLQTSGPESRFFVASCAGQDLASRVYASTRRPQCIPSRSTSLTLIQSLIRRFRPDEEPILFLWAWVILSGT